MLGMIKIDPSGLKQTKWHEYALRFAAGGIITVLAGMIARKWGPGIGGLFLAFPAIFPASATLIEKHQRERKLKKGLHGEKRGTDAAAIDALGSRDGKHRPCGFRRHLLVADTKMPGAIGSGLRDPRLGAGLICHLDHSTTAPAVILNLKTRETTMDILTATKDFEKWVSRHTHVVKTQFSGKHRQIAESPVQFLRGTFYQTTFLALVFASAIQGQPYGPTPRLSVNPIDIFSAFNLPPLPDNAGTALTSSVDALQVGSRAAALFLSDASPTAAWQNAQNLLNQRALQPTKAPSGKTVVFSGATASLLNQVIADSGVVRIEVISEMLSIDQPIEIQRSSVTLDLGPAQLAAANLQPYMMRIENAARVIVTGGDFVSGDSAILVSASSEVDISHVRMGNLTGTGVVVTGSTRITVAENQIANLQLAGIIVHRGTTQSIVENNRITGGAGYSNMAAGIVITDREVDMTSNPRALFGPDGYGVISQPMMLRLHPPHDNLIAWNNVSGGLTSGIYSDGGIETVIFGNVLEGNSKEGLCLDNGSTANVVASNVVHNNGERWGDPDTVLALDFILAGGRLPNGTAAEKVPGISLDNAMYNIVFGNDLAHNFGGGVKMVRTSYFNAIGMNTLLDNNDGASSAFHFFGIELGATSGSALDLDFTPSRGNIVFSNMIRGSHYSGVFFDQGSDTNNVLNNVVLDALFWALESVEQMMNTSLNNFTTLPSRNIGSGLDPALVTSGQAVNDQ